MPTNKIKKFIKNLMYKIYMPREAYYLYVEANKALKNNNHDEALELLLMSSRKYPNNYRIHAEIVNLAMSNKEWDIAGKHWEIIFKLKKGRVRSVAYLGYARVLRNQGKHLKAEKILSEAMNYYHNN